LYKHEGEHQEHFDTDGSWWIVKRLIFVDENAKGDDEVEYLGIEVG